MTRRASEKKYVKRDSIRGNDSLSPEIRFVLYCADHIRPKFLAVPAWLIGAGPMGLNLAELGELTGLGPVSCENTLDVLVARSLAKELDSTLPGEHCRWYAVLPLAIVHGLGRAKEIEDPKESEEQKSGSINPGGIYNTSPCDILSTESLDHKTDLKNIPAPDCNRKPKSYPGLENNHSISTGSSLTIKGPAPVAVKRRRKKLKVLPAPKGSGKIIESKQSPRAALAEDLKAESKRRYGKRGKYQTYLKNPSKNPALLEWEKKPRPNRWNSLDWIGYWLHLWCKYYEEEDPNFVGQTCHRTIARSRERTKTGLDVYWSTGMQMERFRDNTRAFKGSGIELKEYLDWLFNEYLPESAWIDTPISANQIFRVTGNFFLDKFKMRNVKQKKGKKKQKGKWNAWGYSYE